MISEATITSAAARSAAFVGDLLRHPEALRGPMLRGGIVQEFEQLAARHWGYAHCLATCNATTALLTLATVLDLRGAEIIIPPHAWPGSYGPFAHLEALLQRGDANEHGNLDPHTLSHHLTPKTRAILAVDWQGAPHDARAIRQYCDAHHLFYLADTSHPLASGVCADAQTVSFGPGKPIALGEGGALLTNDKSLYERCVAISQHPERCAIESIPVPQGSPYFCGRMHPLAALIGSALLTNRAPQK
jgi:dTDP-4-amino-4,6-dideoxygalactose transaminase